MIGWSELGRQDGARAVSRQSWNTYGLRPTRWDTRLIGRYRLHGRAVQREEPVREEPHAGPDDRIELGVVHQPRQGPGGVGSYLRAQQATSPVAFKELVRFSGQPLRRLGVHGRRELQHGHVVVAGPGQRQRLVRCVASDVEDCGCRWWQTPGGATDAGHRCARALQRWRGDPARRHRRGLPSGRPTRAHACTAENPQRFAEVDADADLRVVVLFAPPLR
jgi:hypothetical protein